MTKLDEAGRREAIHRWLERLGRASVSDLATQFGVSSVTIRKDLSELELRGLLTRVHGGATRTSLKDEGSFPFRLQDQAEQKRDIARRAARLVHSGDRIALDSSTTAHHLAHELLELRDLFVLTYSIPTATLFLDSSSAFVFLLGGPMRRSSRACAVTPMSSCFGGQVDLFFFSARGASPAEGFSEVSSAEAEAKRTLALASRRNFALLDSSKFTADAYHPWLPTSRVTGLITDRGLSPALAEAWRAAGLSVDTGGPVRGGGVPP
ncbi:DeoR/GlpR family DNA-binding transcription regulator [Tessaracoccus flavescens]|uniref:Lactose phosphotransferase system repressor n=1 Tax=Tessaracoccus flavescens TaxID=399497 RepID=A0A1Q2CVF7_9ACTN|nr:DeoR/GlpR family DNA-binding transcription regulator [Tessaracoccus flavescens]AQP50088.1 hypothetical protein BW733_03800 [Tessaracoccus flavescens]